MFYSHATRELSPADADLSLEIALAIWGLSPEAARAVTSRPLGDGASADSGN